MAIELEYVLPSEIEKRSFEIITEELTQSGIVLDPEKAPVIKRCIHTSADFDYAQNLVFSENAIARFRCSYTVASPLFANGITSSMNASLPVSETYL